jgi:VWFA-related protein
MLWRYSFSLFPRLIPLAASLWLLVPLLTDAQSNGSPTSQFPQLIPRTPDQREQRYQNLHRVFLSVQVTTASGQPAIDLKQADFKLLVDDQPHEIASFQPFNINSTMLPPRIVFVVDALNNSSGKVESYRKAIAKYLQTGSGPLFNPTSIALVSEHGTELGSFSTERAAVLSQLDRLSANIHSMSCRDTTIDRVQESDSHDHNPRLDCLDHLFSSSTTALNSIGESLVLSRSMAHRPLRTIVVWFGRGWPFLNEPGYTPDTPEIQESFFRNLVNISGALTEAQVTLDAVPSSEILPVGPKALPHSYFFRGISNPKDAIAADLSLQAFAWQSGGIVVSGTKDISAQIERCVDDARSYYLLAFDYPPSANFGQHHALAVALDKPGLTARTRTLYYAEQ